MRSLLAAALCSAALAHAADPAQIRSAATRALSLMQASQKNWFDQQNCNSCHHQYQPALAFREARAHGIPFDEKIAREDARHAFVDQDLDRAVQYSYVIEPAMDDGYRLVAADAAGLRPNLISHIYARRLAARQAADGHWESFHQRPPASYSRFTQAALALRAIQLYAPEVASVPVARARAWLTSHAPRDTEERTYQLLGLHWAGANRVTLDKAARELEALQQSDGGWNSLDGRESDAYSTGQALFALHDAGGIATSDAAWERGIDYLLKTQAADGSWHVATRLYPPAPVSPPYFESGYPYGHDQFLSMSGASWAVMALADALPPVKAAAPTLQIDASSFEPWAQTILFGNIQDLKGLLDKGFDPNSATKSGGTTALMMAAPDVEKLKLLLDRGAKVNARAKTGYSALMVAAQYRESTVAMNLLLDRGAEVRAPAGQPAPLFNAHPFFLAAYAGNTEILKRLRDAGDKVNDAMILIGTSRATPLAGAARFGDIDVARTLLDLGAPADEVDPSGMTPLFRAVLSNEPVVAKFLIDHGADVNRIDKGGMTPLLYAASIDFGDSTMIDVLLKAGARTDARTKEGLTALDLARKYRHTHLFASLTR